MSTPNTHLPQFALPGTWVRIDLSSADSTKASIHHAAERIVGRADAAAQLRADIRSQFELAADAAQQSNALEYYVAQEITPGVPLSASLSVHLPRLDLARLNEFGLAELAGVLGVGVEAGALPDGEKTLDGPEVTVVRQTFHRLLTAPDSEVELPTLRADYWVAAAHPARISLLSFTTAFVDLEAELLELFDAIVQSTRWPIPSAPVH